MVHSDEVDETGPDLGSRASNLRVRLLSEPKTFGRIVGNSHSFHGRFLVRLDDGLRGSFSFFDVDPLTDDARLWLEGFMIGQEPSPYDVLGDAYDIQVERQRAEWDAAVLLFHQSGVFRRSSQIDRRLYIPRQRIAKLFGTDVAWKSGGGSTSIQTNLEKDVVLTLEVIREEGVVKASVLHLQKVLVEVELEWCRSITVRDGVVKILSGEWALLEIDPSKFPFIFVTAP